MSFRTYLKRLQKRHYPSHRAFAAALGIDPTRLSRGTPFDLRGCLNLARITGEHPSKVLRAAGKGDMADLIESLYGRGTPSLTAEQQRFLEALAAIPDPLVRAALLEVARAAAPGPASGPHVQPKPNHAPVALTRRFDDVRHG